MAAPVWGQAAIDVNGDVVVSASVDTPVPQGPHATPWNIWDQVLLVGNSGDGSLSITGGGSVSTMFTRIGQNATGTGTVTVDGNGSLLTTGIGGNGLFAIGAGGTGILNITGGGRVASGDGSVGDGSGSTGIVTVDGPGSKWEITTSMGLYVGHYGAGTLNITNGGSVSSNSSYAVIGIGSGSTGTVTVDGAGSQFDFNSDIYVGVSGTGTLNITNGGSVSSASGVLGGLGVGKGTVTVNGAGSKWTLSDSLTVGNEGSGTLKITNSGSVSSSGYGYIGDAVGANGTVTVDGPGSKWTINPLTTWDGYLYVGNSGTGTLNITNGGSVASAYGELGAMPGGQGTVTVNGSNSKWSVSHDLTVGNEGNGTLNIENSGQVSASNVLVSANVGTGVISLNGGTLNAPHVDIGSQGTLSGSGIVNGAVTVADGGTLSGTGSVFGAVTVADGGTLKGASGGTLYIAGGLTLNPTSNIDVTLGANSAPELFWINRSLTLDGVLNVSSAGGFGPGLYHIIGQEYTTDSASPSYGSFTNNGLEIGATPAGYSASDLTLIVGDPYLTSTVEQWFGYVNGVLTPFAANVLGRDINLLVGAASPTSYNYWTSGSGIWNGSNGNWSNYNNSGAGAYDHAAMLFFTGPGGTVQVDGGGGALPIGEGIQFFTNGYTITGDGLALTAPTTTFRVGDGTAAGAAMTATIASAISGDGGIEKTDLGTLVLTGANSYSGGTTLSAGTLQLGGAGTLGAATGALTINGGSLDLGGTSQTVGSLSGAGGVITNSNTAAGALTVNQASDTTYAGAITDGAGTVALSKDGAGTLTLSGANTYTGATTVSGGTLKAGAADGIASSSQLTLDAGTTFDTNGYNQSVNNLNGDAGSAINLSGNGTLTLNGSAAPNTFAGIIAGSGGLTLASGTEILSGANTYTGATTVNGGTLQAGADNTFSPGSPTTVKTGGTLDLGGYSQKINAVALAGGAIGNGNLTGAITSSGGTVSGISGLASLTTTTGTTTLTGTNTYTGNTTVNGGTLQAGADNNNTFSPGSLTTVNAGGTLDLGGTPQTINTVRLAGGTIGNGDLTGAITSSGGTVNGIGGSATLTTTGGTTTLTGTNSYTGNTTVNGGTLKGGAADTFSADSPTTVNAGGTLDLGGYQQTINTVTLAGGTIQHGDLTGAITSSGGTVNGIGGPASLTTTGGITTLFGQNTYSGATNVNGGTLAAGAVNTFSPNSVVTVASGAILALNGYDQTIAGLRNAGTVSLRGAAPGTTLTVTGDYERLGSQILINSKLGGDNSPTDKIVVGGNVTGNPGQATQVDVQNMGGTGAATSKGIAVIEVGGTSPDGAFALAGGQRSIPAGIYEYVLQKGSPVTGGDSWYLVSAINPTSAPVNPQTPVNPSSPSTSNPSASASNPPALQPIYRPGATSYVAAQFLNAGQGFQQLYTLHQRVGEHRNLPEERQTWARTSYSTSQEDGKTRYGYDQDTIGLQIGQELIARRSGHATQRAALAFDYGYTKADFSDSIRPLVGLNEKTGEGNAEAWAFEGYFTQIYDGGAYFDIVGQAAALRNEYAIFESDGSRYKANQNGWRAGISGEAGYPLWQSDKWALEGHGQLSYQYASYADFEDRAAKKISDADAHSLRARLGTRLARELVKKEKRSLEAYGVVNLVADLIQPAGVDVQSNGYSVRISEDYDPLYGEIGAGVQGYVTGSMSLFADFRYQHGFNSDNDRRGYAVNAGLRVGF